MKSSCLRNMYLKIKCSKKYILNLIGKLLNIPKSSFVTPCRKMEIWVFRAMYPRGWFWGVLSGE